MEVGAGSGRGMFLVEVYGRGAVVLEPAMASVRNRGGRIDLLLEFPILQ